MKAVVLEIRDGEAAVLREDGVVVRVRRQCEVGDTIELAEEKKILSLRSFRTLAAAACLAVVLTTSGVYGYTTALACTYVSVDVAGENADEAEYSSAGSVEYALNRRNRVIGVKALDASGEAAAEELMRRGVKGMTLGEALDLTGEVLQGKDSAEEDAGAGLWINVFSNPKNIPGKNERIIEEISKLFLT